ncbi:MAG: thiol:disulfide interchange protein DsbA/DsbL [Cellvibrionaceae bacterium]|nr:thiol:disulfide interchange protein DsbA/DsbL [Cellvibrionaceae bacterium]MCV6627396.1 thiol:disulfide interchange protein DsbA/DsbL [Cellvibrionaceae bacterium]
MRAITAFIAVLFSAISLTACAQAEQPFESGKHYSELEVPLKTGSDKIQVEEFFSYGCGHCFKFEPLMKKWKKTLADDVEVVQTPVAWQLVEPGHRAYGQVVLAKAYYIGKALKVLDKVHEPIFEGIFTERKNLGDEAELAKVFEAAGVPAEKFNKVVNSFGINTQVRMANARARGAKVSGTPEIVVDGRYRISSRQAGSHENMLKVANFLVAQIRAEKAPK